MDNTDYPKELILNPKVLGFTKYYPLNPFTNEKKPYEKQLITHFHPAKFRLYGGGRGGAKTTWLIEEGIRLNTLIRDCRGVIFRRNYPNLKRYIIDKFTRLVPSDVAEYIDHDKVARFYYKGNKKDIFSLIYFAHCDDPDALQSHAGIEYDWIACDELEEMDFPDFFDMVKGSLRSTNIHRMKLGIEPCFFATAMPATQVGANGKGALQFIRSHFIDKNADYMEYDRKDFFFMPTTLEDNPVLTQSDPNYVKSIKSVSSDKLREAWLKGNWYIFEGQYFTRFDQKFHVVDDLPIDSWDENNCWGVYSQNWKNNEIDSRYEEYLDSIGINCDRQLTADHKTTRPLTTNDSPLTTHHSPTTHYSPLTVEQLTTKKRLDEIPLEVRTFKFNRIIELMDYGFNDPTTCIWMAVDEAGNLWFYREYGSSNLFPDEQAEIISELMTPMELSIHTRKIMDVQAWNRYGDLGRQSDSPAEIMIKVFREKEKRCWMDKAEGSVKDRVNGWRLVHRWLGSNGIEYPRVFITRSCRRIIDGLINATCDDKIPDDIREGEWDDYLDPVRYGIMMRGTPKKKDDNESIRQLLRNAKEGSAIKKFFSSKPEFRDIIGSK